MRKTDKADTFDAALMLNGRVVVYKAIRKHEQGHKDGKAPPKTALRKVTPKRGKR